ncbi:MAG TPA: serpin family protein [Mariniphaga anaerophila]|uniref:Serpin family protein n=1 Tax=Mariniphaga anaerophila TaxID=1484053 RepID=A0A831PL64_9BACT|nr:serpin family protein [Mariniphaga anaerophila]
MKTIILLMLAFVLTSISSCQKNDPVPDENKIINLDEKSAQLVEADNAFGLELFQTIRAESEEENLMVSPLSVSVALAMAYNGAGSDTKSEMEKVLKLNGLTKEQINASYNKLISALQSLDDEVVFEIANAIFYADGFSVKPDFLSINEDVYDAEVSKLNFSSPAAVETINNWVAEKTHDKIQKIIEQLNPLDRMVLLNAIYFYGTWTNEFDKEGTHNLPFRKTDGTTLEVPMMNKMEKLPYKENTLFKAIKMPYGNGQYNMVILLPVGSNSSQDIIDVLTIANWNSWMGTFELTDRVKITMPRFKYAFETSLKKVLKDLGMEKAFLPNMADFSGISNEDLYISEAIHKSYIDVNETGTEAAAVTGLVFATTSIGNEPPVVPFYVDRPFVYAITENDTGAILFIGEVNHPEYE